MKIEKTREPNKKELNNIRDTENMLSQEKKLPPTHQMARNLAIDMWRSFKGMVKGQKLLTDTDKAKKRWSVCEDCPFLLYDEVKPDTNKIDGRCIECGCFMNIKVHFEHSKCPIQKW